MVRKWDENSFDHISYMNFGDCARYQIEDNPWLKELIENDVADHYDFSLPCNVTPEGGFTSSMPLEYCEEMWIDREVKEFLQNRNKERPFYLHVGYDHPHDPIAPSEEFDKLFNREMVELPENYKDDFTGKPEFLKQKRMEKRGYPFTPVNKDHLKRLVAKQYALVSLIDHSIGKIIEEIKNQGELENTLIVYTSDHGDFAGEHGMVLKNLGIYQSIHRVPCIISWPEKFKKDFKTD